VKRYAMSVLGGGVMAGVLATYLGLGRKPCLTWGATPEVITRTMPGDDLLSNPDFLSTRAITIDAPASSIWPWLVQMGSVEGGVYTYDWIENLFGLHMHGVDEILPQFQNRKVCDIEQLGKNGPRLRVDILDTERAMVLHSEDGNWVWAFCLYPVGSNRTTLVSRNRIATPAAGRPQRAFGVLVMEPGSLIMERKMLLGIKQRAERLAGQKGAHPEATMVEHRLDAGDGRLEGYVGGAHS
jgi:hypothetical protein